MTSGKPAAWVKFGERGVREHCHTIFEGLLSELKNVCGAEVAATAQACVQRGLDSFRDQKGLILHSATIEQVLDIYDARNAYYSVFGVHALFNMADPENYPDDTAEGNTASGMKLLIQAAQIINDLEDLYDARHKRGRSDIRNGVITLPILFLFHSLSVEEKREFLSFWSQREPLNPAQEQFLLHVLSNYQVVQQMSRRIHDTYKHARQLLAPAIPSQYHDLFNRWIDYKIPTPSTLRYNN